jgi:hypothetical protein
VQENATTKMFRLAWMVFFATVAMLAYVQENVIIRISGQCYNNDTFKCVNGTLTPL